MLSKKVFMIISLVFISTFLIYNNIDILSSNIFTRSDENQLETSINSQKYICPMHSHILSHEEGDCPICGMDLVINQSAMLTPEFNIAIVQSKDNLVSTYPEVKISPVVVHNLGIKSAHVTRGNLEHHIETIGKITRVDPMARTRITSPLSGKIIDITNKYGGDKIKQDEFLFSVASEELFSLEKAFQQTFISGDKATSSAMIPKLVAMGLDAEQVANLQNGSTPSMPANVYAKEDGYIFTKRGEIGEAITSSFTVFNLGGDYQVIEVTVEIFERQWDLVKEGQAATMQLRNLPGKIFHGVVERVDEPVGYTTRALESRLKFKTTHKGMTQSTFARVIIDGKSRENVLIVPRDAVIRTAEGERIVKINTDGSYQPVTVLVGEEADGKIEILSGIDENDLVVISGQFLIDSESNLLAGLRRFTNKPTAEDDTKNSTIEKIDSEKAILNHVHKH